jgi:hypothetical protein
MYPTFHHYVAAARAADLHHHAAQERMAKAARYARRPQPRHSTRSGPGHPAAALAHRALTVLGASSPTPTR